MDNLLYIARSGATDNMNSLAVRSNNLANANTVGFKADLEQARAMQAYGDGLPSRVFAMTESPGQRMDQGGLMTTGRDLDIAIQGDGMLAVQDANGKEAYTRMGNLRVSPLGVLETSTGLSVLDDAGNPIVLPLPMEKVEINQDGTVIGRPEGSTPETVEEYQRIKLVLPDIKAINKGDDGLFRRNDSQSEQASASVRVASGALESSNVNVVDEMTNLIRLQRQYETQVKMMQTADKNDEAQNQLLRLV